MSKAPRIPTEGDAWGFFIGVVKTWRVNMGKGESLASPRRIAAREREGQALEMRLSGMSFAAIADALQFKDASGAFRVVQRAMARLGKPESAEQVREVEVQRLDQLLLAMWSAAKDSKDPAAVDRCLKIMERRSKLLGLDAPEKHQIGELSPVAREESLEGLPYADVDGKATE